MRSVACLLLAWSAAAAAAESWWTPFPNDLIDAVRDQGPWSVVRDGEFGADVLWLHEPGATGGPRVVRDGLPLGTGHRWCDDPWTIGLAGAELRPAATGGGGAFDGGGVLQLRSAPADTGGAVVDARFFKGQDESYLRRLAFRTQRAPWIVRFDFDEQILHDFSTTTDLGAGDLPPFPAVPGDARAWTGAPAGEAKNRLSRIAVNRRLEDGSRLDLAYSRMRKHKTTLPVQELVRNDVRGERFQARWRGALGAGTLAVGVVSDGADLVVDPLETDVDERTLETVREALLLTASDVVPGWRLEAEAAGWRLADTGAGGAWAGDAAGPTRARGREAELGLGRDLRLGGWRAAPRAAAAWTDAAGVRPALGLDLIRGGWTVEVARGGRAPRSDERATAWTVASPAARYRLLPADDLDWERTDRAALRWSGRRRGWTLGAGAVYRRLRDGIGWRPLEVGEGARPERTGRWDNGLAVDGWVATLRASRRGHLLGLWQLDAHLSLRGQDVDGGPADLRPVGLPPSRNAAVTARWQHAYFRGDGVLELAWTVDHRAAMDDPWLPDAGAALPAATLHHAMVMFRLTGADLGLDIRNVLDRDVQLSSGTLARGREIRWRLEWVLRR